MCDCLPPDYDGPILVPHKWSCPESSKVSIEPLGSIYGTKSSDRWKSTPGKMDTLNTRLIFESVGRWGIPVLQPCSFVPETLAAWHDPKQRAHAAEIMTCQEVDTSSGRVKTLTRPRGALHFFVDDYRFEKVWSKPELTYERVAEVGAALSPDFSMWRDMPAAVQLWQVYRSRWCAAFWQHLGVEVIPTATWGGENTYEFCFDGIPQRSTVAISMLGVRKAGRQLFLNGLKSLISHCNPSLILSYGGISPSMLDEISTPVREYETSLDMFRRNKIGG